MKESRIGTGKGKTQNNITVFAYLFHVQISGAWLSYFMCKYISLMKSILCFFRENAQDVRNAVVGDGLAPVKTKKQGPRLTACASAQGMCLCLHSFMNISSPYLWKPFFF